MSGNSSLSNGHLSDALVSRKHKDTYRRATNGTLYENPYAQLPSPDMYPVFFPVLFTTE